MTKIIQTKKFKMKIFKRTYWFEIKEPYLTNQDYTTDEVHKFIDKYSPFSIIDGGKMARSLIITQ